MIQLVYPVIRARINDYGYNITCSVISFLGLLSQFLNIPDLLKTCKKCLSAVGSVNMKKMKKLNYVTVVKETDAKNAANGLAV